MRFAAHTIAGSLVAITGISIGFQALSFSDHRGGDSNRSSVAIEPVNAVIRDHHEKHRELKHLFPEGTRVIELTEFFVDQDEVIEVLEDTAYIVDGPIRIHGNIRTLTPVGMIDAPSISLYSSDSIWISGEISVADGNNGQWPGQPGGNGGSLALGAPWIALAQEFLIGGFAGEAGPAGDGGNGGNIEVFGIAYRYGHREGQDFVTAIGGDGSRGTNGDSLLGEEFRHGGNGGDGGNARFLPAAESEILATLAQRGGPDGIPGTPGPDGPFGADGTDGATIGRCMDGTIGKNGNPSLAGGGGNGGDGDDAYIIPPPPGSQFALISPAGNGGIGGSGGQAIAGDGGNGGHGGPCCDFTPGVGGDGAIGMNGGIAVAGHAGNGGNGGDGIANGVAEGGHGGDGGHGGHAAGGHGGHGGNGGDGFPVGGQGGDGGTSGDSSFGFGGDGGSAGQFAPPMSDGDPGDDGVGIPANFGGAGNDGDPCYTGG